MKKLCMVLLVGLLLAGCGKEQARETVMDVPATPVVAAARRIQVQLPPDLTAPVLQNQEHGTLYLCDTYSVTVQTVESGDLKKTIRNATGLNAEDLQIMRTKQGDAKRYQFMWTANGENGIQVGRTCILDDGVYHYVLTALSDEAAAKQVQPVWKEIFTSFCLASEREQVSTGS